MGYISSRPIFLSTLKLRARSGGEENSNNKKMKYKPACHCILSIIFLQVSFVCAMQSVCCELQKS